MTGLHRFQEAEPLVVNGYRGLKDNPAVSPDRKRGALERVVKLYEAWNRFEWPPVERKYLPACGRGALAMILAAVLGPCDKTP